MSVEALKYKLLQAAKASFICLPDGLQNADSDHTQLCIVLCSLETG